jgi:ubiquinone/menaquinone biosynthesis C-methylase UbiE
MGILNLYQKQGIDELMKRTINHVKNQFEKGLYKYPDRDKKFKDGFIKLIDLYNPKSILEIGCGNGRNLKVIKELRSNIIVFGVELTDYGCIETSNIIGKNNIYNCSAETIPFPDSSIDLIFTFHAIEQMKYIIIDVVNEMYRVCKMGCLLFEPIYERQNLAGKLHNKKLDYARNIESIVNQSGFIIQKIFIPDFIYINKKNITYCIICKK